MDITNDITLSTSVPCIEAEHHASFNYIDGVFPTDNCDKDVLRLKNAMFDRLMHSSAHFKHQQRDEPDLSDSEKTQIMTALLARSPAIFLARFGNFMELENLEFFTQYCDDYEVQFRVEDLRSFFKNKQTIVKNRRYQAMTQIMNSGDYFTEDEMKHRDPLLYEQMIGRYLNDEDVSIDKSDLTLSSILIKHIDIKRDNYICEIQKEIQDSQYEEEEDSDENENVETNIADVGDEIGAISCDEIRQIKDEFLHTMQERFIMGEDKQFDYSAVDYNTEYDPVNIQDQDDEERYFSGPDSDEL